MCGTVVAADTPGEDQERFKNFIIEINMQMTDQEVMDKLAYYIDSESDRRMKAQIGLTWSRYYTQERYAERFVEVLESL